MTKAELLARVTRDRPGESTEAELELWIRQLEQKWFDEVVRTHHGAWNPANVPRVEMLSEGTWWGEDSTATGYGLTVTRTGPRIAITGTATESCQIWINGPALAIADSHQGEWSYQSPMVGPEEGDWTINYLYTKGGQAVGMTLGKSVDGTTVLRTNLNLPLDGHSVTGSNISWHTMSWALKINGGSVFPAGWELVMLLNTEEKTLPEERIRRDLLIPAIDEEVYVYWLYSKIDFRLGEMERYNNDAAMFNQGWLEAAKRWNRQHMPLGMQQRHVVYGHPVPWWADEDPLNQRG